MTPGDEVMRILRVSDNELVFFTRRRHQCFVDPYSGGAEIRHHFQPQKRRLHRLASHQIKGVLSFYNREIKNRVL